MRFRIPVALGPLFSLISCGYPGDTRPPSLNLPVPVTDLAAIQRGSTIVVQFTVPRLSTDGIALKTPPPLELYIAGAKFKVKPDKPLVSEQEPATPFAGQTVKIGVKAFNDRYQDAGWSNIIDLPVIPALSTPIELAAVAVAAGVQVTWKSPDRKFRVLRAGPDQKTFVPVGEADARVYTDSTAEFGKTYRYIVQAIDPEIKPAAESDLSAEVSVTPIDKFAPAVPANVTAIVGTQTVELLWDRDTESDLAGYRVFRDGKQIGESKDAPSFSDRTIEHGKHYVYAVSAYDKLNNESAKSEPVDVQIP